MSMWTRFNGPGGPPGAPGPRGITGPAGVAGYSKIDNTKAAQYTGEPVTIADATFGDLTWDHLDKGSDLLDRSVLTRPTVLASGIYTISATISSVDGMTVGTDFFAAVHVDPDGAFPGERLSIASGSHASLATNDHPYIGVSLTQYIAAGTEIAILAKNLEGDGFPKQFSITEANVVLLQTDAQLVPPATGAVLHQFDFTFADFADWSTTPGDPAYTPVIYTLPQGSVLLSSGLIVTDSFDDSDQGQLRIRTADKVAVVNNGVSSATVPAVSHGLQSAFKAGTISASVNGMVAPLVGLAGDVGLLVENDQLAGDGSKGSVTVYLLVATPV